MNDQVTHATTGNPMMPAHPDVQQNMAAELGPQAQQPAQQPAPAPAAEPAPSSQSDQDFFEDFLGASPPPQQPAQQQPAPQAQPGVEPPAGAPQPQQQAPGEPPLTPEQVEALAAANQPQPDQQPVQPQVDPATAEQQAITHLEQNMYGLTEDEAKDIIAEPDKVLPRLAARIHVAVAQQIGQLVGQFMPQQVEAIVQSRMKSVRAENDFFSKYPALADKRFAPVVAQSLRAAKGANPQGTREDIMQMGAQLAAMKLRVNIQGQQQQQQAPPQQPGAPQAPGQQPFMPAVNGAGPHQPGTQAPPEDNIFAELAADPDW